MLLSVAEEGPDNAVHLNLARHEPLHRLGYHGIIVWPEYGEGTYQVQPKGLCIPVSSPIRLPPHPMVLELWTMFRNWTFLRQNPYHSVAPYGPEHPLYALFERGLRPRDDIAREAFTLDAPGK